MVVYLQVINFVGDLDTDGRNIPATKRQDLSQFDARKSVCHHTIQINQPTRCDSFTSLLLDVYVWLNMFQAPLRSSSGAYNYPRILWFYCWRVAVGALLVVVWPDHSKAPTTILQQ